MFTSVYSVSLELMLILVLLLGSAVMLLFVFLPRRAGKISSRLISLLLLSVIGGLFALKLTAAYLIENATVFKDPQKVLKQVDRQGLAQLNQVSAISDETYRWQALPQVAPAPEDNPTTAAKVALGKELFHDKNLSADRSLACVSCHGLDRKNGGADGKPGSVGIYQQVGVRNAPTVFNAAFQKVFFWDGRAASLEEQALGPLVNPIEMGMPDLDSVLHRINQQPRYRLLFHRAFPEASELTIEEVAKAIAAYERTLITPNSPYDRFLAGDKSAMTSQQLAGMALFEQSGCVHCHSGPNFSAASVFSETSEYRTFPAAESQYTQTYDLVSDLGAKPIAEGKPGLWRVPSLRNVTLTAPYFHNGSVETLEEAVRVMARVQLNKTLSERTEDDSQSYWRTLEQRFSWDRNQALSDNEVDAIVAFLHALEADRLPEVQE